MEAQYNIGDRVSFEGMPGTVKDIKFFQCGKWHYLIYWDNGGRKWLSGDLLQDES